MNITKTTATAILLGVFGAMPMTGSAQQSVDTSIRTTCIVNCGKLSDAQMKQQTTTSSTGTTDEGNPSSKSLSKPSNRPSEVYDAFGKCIANCIQASK